ncbi:MAG TPA: restriction endonuclease [Jatrophihabitans sp.]|uniref:restriction endonuclease n=1 Tax=Jatrophihabitans sp. TaxID=1932789 RepID=UPI002EF97D42
MTSQARGQLFNRFVADLLHADGIEAHSNLRGSGEIDVAFSVNNQRFVIEAKWEKPPVSTDAIAKLEKRVRQRLTGTLGIFLSMSGYTTAALDDLRQGGRTEVLLLDRHHLEWLLAGLTSADELMGRLLDQASYFGDPYATIERLFATNGRAEPPRVRPAEPPIDGHAPIILTHSSLNSSGISADGDALLLTTTDGVWRVEPATSKVELVVPIAGISNPVWRTAEGYLIVRREGAALYQEGLSVVLGGGIQGAVRAILGVDGSRWLFSNGSDGLRRHEPLVQCLPAELRAPALPPRQLDYPVMSAMNAQWLSDTQLLVVGNPGAWLYELVPDVTSTEVRAVQRLRFDQANPMGIAVRDSQEVFVAAGEMEVVRIDTSDLSIRVVQHVALGGSVSSLAATSDGFLYLLAYRMASGQEPQCLVVQLGV